MISTFFIIFLFVNFVSAIPGIPHQFYGSVTLNGQPAPDGTIIVAKINGIEVARTTTKDGKYGYNPIFYIDDPNNDRSGKEIRFFVNGIDTGQTKYFCNSCVTELNLTASSSSTPPSGPSGPGPSAPAPSMPTENQEKEEEPTAQTCEERWVCTEWSVCADGVQTRTCTDQNNCGTEENKPLETQPCSMKEESEQQSEETPTQDITGMFISTISNPAFALVIILAIIAVVLSIFSFRLRKKKKK